MLPCVDEKRGICPSLEVNKLWPVVQTCPPPVFVIGVALGYSRKHHLLTVYGCSLTTMEGLSICSRDHSLPRWLSVKKLPANAGEAGSIPGSGRSYRVGNSNPLQYSCLENPMDRGAQWATVHEVTKSQTWLRSLNRDHSSAKPQIFIIKAFIEKNCWSLLYVSQWEWPFKSRVFRCHCQCFFSCIMIHATRKKKLKAEGQRSRRNNYWFF